MYKYWEPVKLAHFPGEKTLQLKLKRFKLPNQADVIYFYKDQVFHFNSTDGSVEILVSEYNELVKIIQENND